jgi:hypothetical protein
MVKQCFTLHNDTSDSRTDLLLHKICIFLSVIAIIASAFHFWPFVHSKTWQMLNISNFSVMLGVIVILAISLARYHLGRIRSFLPHISIIVYLAINILSMAMANDLGRAANFTAKILLVLLGGSMMFRAALPDIRSIRIFYNAMIIAVIISILYCLVARFIQHINKFGFHENVFKYGTFIGILVPACATYLFSKLTIWSRLLAITLVICAFVSAGSAGAVAAIIMGLLAGMAVIRQASVRRLIMASIAFGLISLFFINLSVGTAMRNDLMLSETDGKHLRQRYIEWQAEINSLQERTIAGMATGCINDYRSTFYYRLPKLNTLQPFDQNGWLATAAETGIVGLMCFCWIFVSHGKMAYASILKCRNANSPLMACAGANIAGLAAACVANLFSSVQYNGILIIFVLLLALIGGTNRILEESQK